MANLWNLKFGIEKKLPILVRSGTTLGSNISFLSNTVYKDLEGPSDPIDVINTFPWTKSPQSSRKDVPQLRLIEKRITKNSTVSNLAYSLLANVDLANTASVQGANLVDLLAGNENAEVQNSLENLKSTSSDSINSLQNDKGILGTVSRGINEITSQDTFKSNVLRPYNFLYATEKTGFEYIFPYLDNSYRESNITMGEDQQNILGSVVGAAQELAQQVAGLTLALRPGVYIEQAKQFSMGDQGRTLNVSIPLLNTGSFEDISRNWQLIFGLIYQNRPGRITKNLVDVPVIYESFIEGVAYMPYSYISSMSVEFEGSRRTMEINVPVASSSSKGSDTTIQSRKINTVIPDAYKLNLSITGLNDETRNFMYESIDQGLVTTSKTALNNPSTESNDLASPVGKKGTATEAADAGGAVAPRRGSGSARSNPRGSIRRTGG